MTRVAISESRRRVLRAVVLMPEQRWRSQNVGKKDEEDWNSSFSQPLHGRSRFRTSRTTGASLEVQGHPIISKATLLYHLGCTDGERTTNENFRPLTRSPFPTNFDNC